MAAVSHSWGMTTPSRAPEEYEEIPPSQAPKLVPWTEDSNYLSPGGFVAGVSAFADGATSSYRSKASKIFVRAVVLVILLSIIVAGVWRVG